MKKNRKDSFQDMKREVLEKVAPYALRPDVYPLPKLSVEEVAILFTKNESDVMTRAAVTRLEKGALEKMRAMLAKTGISRMADVA